MKKLILIGLLISAATYATMNTDEVKKEFSEPGHIPQGLKPRSYHKLDEVIPLTSQQKIKTKKKQKSVEPSPIPSVSAEPEKHSRFNFSFISVAEAASKSKPTPTPTPSLQPVIENLSKVDLRQFDSPIRNQWDGTCTAHGLIAAMENHLNRAQKQGLSTRYFWSQYQKYSVEAAIRAATQNRQIDETLWPQNKTRPSVASPSIYGKFQMSGSAYLGDDINSVTKALAAKLPVYVGMSVPSDMASCRATIRQSTGVTSGGHALAVVGYVKEPSVAGGGYLILKNSWGTECGDQGYQYMPFALCGKAGMYCMFWSIQGVRKV